MNLKAVHFVKIATLFGERNQSVDFLCLGINVFISSWWRYRWRVK